MTRQTSRLRTVTLAAAIVFLATIAGPSAASSAGVGTITTIAGGGNGDGGAPINASLAPLGIATDGLGNVYAAEFGACRIRKISGGTIATVAGNGNCAFGGDGGAATNANLNRPFDVAADSAGDFYIADRSSCRVRLVSGGTITTIAGDGTCGYGGDGGPATSAHINTPNGVAVTTSGDVFIADTGNCRVRKVTAGTITTVAGSATCGYGGDGGPATNANLRFITGLATDSLGNLFIADTGDCRIREVVGTVIATVAGNGTCAYAGDGASATSASINQARDVIVDGTDLYIADTVNCRLRKVTAGNISTVAGNGICAYGGNGGPVANATLSSPDGLAVAGGVLYLADGCSVRALTAGTIDVFAGGSCTYSGDGGSATNASLYDPYEIALDGHGNLFIADTRNCRVREVSAGTIVTIAGNGTCGYGGDGGAASNALLSSPTGVATGGGNLYIVDSSNCRVREVSGGIITTIAGNGVCTFGGDGGLAVNASLHSPIGIAVDASGDVYIADTYSCRVRKVSGGVITTVAGDGVCTFGGDGGPASNGSLNLPTGLAFDGGGSLYIADYANCRVRRLSAGILSTAAGDGTCSYAGDGGPPTAASLNNPADVAVDPVGNLYISDQYNCRVREVIGNAIVTFAGDGTCAFAGDGGPAASASLLYPWGLAAASDGNIFISDSANRRIRQVLGVAPRNHKLDANGDGYSAADEITAANCGGASCSSITTWGTSETRTCKDAGRNCGAPGAPVDESVPARIAVPPASGYGCSITLDTVGPKTTRKLAQSDIDLDGVVSILDLAKVAGWYGNTINPSPADPRWEGDMDGDGVISILDLVAMASNFGRSVAGNCKVE